MFNLWNPFSWHFFLFLPFSSLCALHYTPPNMFTRARWWKTHAGKFNTGRCSFKSGAAMRFPIHMQRTRSSRTTKPSSCSSYTHWRHLQDRWLNINFIELWTRVVHSKPKTRLLEQCRENGFLFFFSLYFSLFLTLFLLWKFDF